MFDDTSMHNPYTVISVYTANKTLNMNDIDRLNRYLLNQYIQ